MPLTGLLWFDREFDSSGNRIRSDVREAAKSKWLPLSTSARRRLGDRELEIQEIFERAVERVSRYLDRKQAPPQDPSGLLVLKFRQELNSLTRRLGRLTPVGHGKDLEPLLTSAEWGEDADRRLFLEEIIRSLSPDNRLVWRLRKEGYEWSAIAEMLQSKPSTVRKGFWREVRKIHAELNEMVEDEEE
jgi:DNA-directed RNA polymerase specialized sigma24 family protein